MSDNESESDRTARAKRAGPGGPPPTGPRGRACDPEAPAAGLPVVQPCRVEFQVCVREPARLVEDAGTAPDLLVGALQVEADHAVSRGRSEEVRGVPARGEREPRRIDDHVLDLDEVAPAPARRPGRGRTGRLVRLE